MTGTTDEGCADGRGSTEEADPAGSGSGGCAAGLPDVAAAAGVLDGVVRRSRVVPAGTLSVQTGVPVLFKCENEQLTGSFKLRGAYVRLAAADPAARARGVVAASAGNHAQGVAFAAARLGAKATIFVPDGANAVKVARTRRWGARVEHVPGGIDAALRAAAAYADEGARLLVHPFDDLTVVAGQGTVGLELLDQVPDLDTVLVGVGGGGLVTGIAAALRARRPGVRVVGVQASSAPAFAASLRAGRLVARPTATVADGLAVGRPGALTLDLARRLVDDVVTVDEEAFWAAMTSLWADGHRVEPAGAAGVAALLRHPGLARGTTVVVLSGGNLDAATADRLAALAAATPESPRSVAVA
jgi:threonine dehydratase